MISTVIKSVRTSRSDSRSIMSSYVIGFVVFVVGDTEQVTINAVIRMAISRNMSTRLELA